MDWQSDKWLDWLIIRCPSCRIPAMNSTLCTALLCFLMLMDVGLVLGLRYGVVAEDVSNTNNDCWLEVESILLNSSHQYTACMCSRHLIDLSSFSQYLNSLLLTLLQWFDRSNMSHCLLWCESLVTLRLLCDDVALNLDAKYFGSKLIDSIFHRHLYGDGICFAKSFLELILSTPLNRSLWN